MKKMVIVGGGVAGLSAGIYGCLSGYECTVLEKDLHPGGNLTGWDRNGFHVDNCIHWLTGTLPGTELRRMWETLGALSAEVPMCKTERLFGSELGGMSVSLWRDAERTREEMLSLAPFDRDSADRFISLAKLFGEGKMTPALGIAALKYSKIDLFALSATFRHPLLRRVMTDYIPGDYVALGLLMTYGAYISGNADVPLGGSRAMAERMAKRFVSLGGRLVTGAEVSSVRLENTKASGVILQNGNYIPADWVVCACDPEVTFGRLLGRRYTPARLIRCAQNGDAYPLFSSFHAAFAAEGDVSALSNTAVFDVRPLRVGSECIGRMALREYSSQPGFAPEGKSILQTMVFQRAPDCEKWQSLARNDRNAYLEEKERLGGELMTRAEERLGQKLTLLDTWTPATYGRYFGANHGAYMCWAMVPGGRRRHVPNRIKGLDNVLLATQWQEMPGGLPTAAAEGKLAAETAFSLDRPRKSLTRAAAM